MNAVICVTNAGRVTHADSGVFGGNKDSTVGNGLCHTHGGTLSNRSLPLRAGSVRAHLEAARARRCACLPRRASSPEAR